MYVVIWAIIFLIVGFLVGMWIALLTMNENVNSALPLIDYVSLTFTVIGGASGCVGILTAIYIYRGWKKQHRYSIKYETLFNTEDYVELLFKEHDDAINNLLNFIISSQKSNVDLTMVKQQQYDYQSKSKLASLSVEYGLHYMKLIRLGFSTEELSEIHPDKIRVFFEAERNKLNEQFSDEGRQTYVEGFIKCRENFRTTFMSLRNKIN
ncbi:hypothetical protein F0251_24535 [Vibrio sp. 070316B]|uniref:hypothetical protein n=1 Tax=Vibrio sp. 070316B TaxID=2607608 RepID=UPI001493B14D|nr:hypothetical protein [Vibrio sp. 070316B]NOI41559.1 hypothetical protein [Vibrio sp. 070316B]